MAAELSEASLDKLAPRAPRGGEWMPPRAHTFVLPEPMACSGCGARLSGAKEILERCRSRAKRLQLFLA